MALSTITFGNGRTIKPMVLAVERPLGRRGGLKPALQ